MTGAQQDTTSLAPDDALIGTQVGDYLVTARLGEGGMGVVFAGLQPVINKPVAIKVLQWEIARYPAEVQRLLSEAQVVNAIRHRGIVDVIGFGKLPDGRPYLVMELLEGESLEALVRRAAPVDPVLAVTLLAEVLEALGAAHGVGVIHRDLKPSNVFIVRPAHAEPYLKLLDFGLAKRAAEGTRHTPQTRASVVIGTPDYMAPEQARGRPVSPETDLYAIGCIAFELLTGQPPFSATTIYEIMAMHLGTPAPRVRAIRPEVPEELDELVDRLLRKEPAERPSSAFDVRQQLLDLRDRCTAGAETPLGRLPARSAPSLSSLLPNAPEPAPRPVDGPRAALASTVLPAAQASVASTDGLPGRPTLITSEGIASQPTAISPIAVPSAPTVATPVAGRRVPLSAIAVFAAILALAVAGLVVWRSSTAVEPAGAAGPSRGAPLPPLGPPAGFTALPARPVPPAPPATHAAPGPPVPVAPPGVAPGAAAVGAPAAASSRPDAGVAAEGRRLIKKARRGARPAHEPDPMDRRQ